MSAPLPFRLALALASASGFIALAYEIVWARVYSFTTGSHAMAFGAFLGSYLLGLALGSLLSRRWQDRHAGDGPAQVRALARLFIVANAAAFLVVPAIARAVVSTDWLRTLPLPMLGAGLLGTVLPLLCHLAIPSDGHAGQRMAYVYLANIGGSAAGSLLTGFALTDWLRLWQLQAALLVGAVAIGWGLLRQTRAGRASDLAAQLGIAALALASPWLHDGLYERLMYKREYATRPRFTQIVESRHGVITVEGGVTVYGNGIYDGKLETDLRRGGGLFRPFFVSALHPRPREVLVIGMSGGAWTQILAHHPQVERVTVVEIGHGYLELIRGHPAVASLLTNPKVEIAIDDGRRWMRRHPERRFDLIVMNTTFHWREFASALLGREFLELTRVHLAPGGLVMWNTTSSPRAARTALEVFPHTMMVGNNCVASRDPLVVDTTRWREVLSRYTIEGRPVFDLGTEQGRRDLEDTLAFRDIGGSGQSALMDRAQMEAQFGAARPITDDNLGHEYEMDFSKHPTLRRLLGPLVR